MAADTESGTPVPTHEKGDSAPRSKKKVDTDQLSRRSAQELHTHFILILERDCNPSFWGNNQENKSSASSVRWLA